MTTREAIHAQIERLSDESLEELREVLERLAEPCGTPGILSRLQQIRIEAPEDFAANLELYLSGEKHVAENPDAR